MTAHIAPREGIRGPVRRVAQSAGEARTPMALAEAGEVPESCSRNLEFLLLTYTSPRLPRSCTNCLAGRYLTDHHATESKHDSFNDCAWCAAGTISGAGAHGCSDCEAGKYETGSRDQCAICEKGKYSDARKNVCTMCPGGKHISDDEQHASNHAGLGDCLDCGGERHISPV